MASQAERIKQFKHAHCSRLQRVEDEEQWISGEELRTDDSSDEENIRRSKNKKGKKRLSPLVLPKKDNIDLGDILLSVPSFPIDRRFSVPKTISLTGCSTSKEYGIKELPCLIQKDEGDDIPIKTLHKTKSLEESLRMSIEMDKADFWRPKRGSITLPVTNEGEQINTRKMMYEVNDFYIDMIEDLRTLKTKIVEKNKIPKNVAGDNQPKATRNEKEGSIANWKEDPNVQKHLSIISDLDKKISSNSNLLKEVRHEGQEFEEEMCKILEQMKNRESDAFLQLCKYGGSEDENEEIVEEEEEEENEDEKKLNKKKKIKFENFTDRYAKDFIKKNIELAKAGAMATSSLTDEEKIKLDSLLADLDSLELTDDDVIKNAEPTLFLNENTEKEIVEKLYKIEEEIPDDSLVENGFKFFPNEQSRLDELDVKLNDLINSFADSISKEESTSNEFENLDEADKKGKFWKHQLLEKRLKDIDKVLTRIQKEKSNENNDKSETDDAKCENKNAIEGENGEIKEDVVAKIMKEIELEVRRITKEEEDIEE